ncbi:hypothetical protein LCGC14_3153990, partial [marine sediment metagenome]
GNVVDDEEPFYFSKMLHSVLGSAEVLPYPPNTQNFHHEIEFVVALGQPAFQIDAEDAMEAVFGYACGLDMTRRDLQARAKSRNRPWLLGKDAEGSAVLGPLTPVAQFGEIGGQEITLTVNDELRQQGTLSDLVFPVPRIIAHLSHYYHLGPGDIVMTGTPSGVGPVISGDRLEGRVAGLSPVTVSIA